MISLGFSHLFQILTCILLLTQSFSEDERKTYIVYMGERPRGVESTELLHKSMVQRVLGSKFAPDVLLHSYKSFNGFVARLTKEETLRIRGMDDVVSVIPNRNNKLHTSRSWDFLGFPQHVDRSELEKDMIVGVIDTGIWPESDSFKGDGLGPRPAKWRGICQNFTCNNKIIGARYHRTSGRFGPTDIISPRDTNGHGTHCASIAAGIPVLKSLYGLGSGIVRGGAPLARIAVYKVCWSLGCESADILAAFDAAIADGVDILSVSMGTPKRRYANYFDDIYAIGSFHAIKKGILMSQAAGNDGPGFYTTLNTAPWTFSVAASTTDRKFYTEVKLGNNMSFQGISINTFDLENNYYPLIYGGDAPNTFDGYISSQSRFCYPESLNGAMVRRKIVLCDGVLDPSRVGFLHGAIGVIFASTRPLVDAEIYAIPAVQLSENDGLQIRRYSQSPLPTATISKSTEGKDPCAPFAPPFSSRGPNIIDLDIMKPDIAAPGVEILAAWPPRAPISDVDGDTRESSYKFLSGTSMACPHVSATAIYVKSFHPTWSRAMIKSAIMTTATPMSPQINIEAEFAYGAGQINPIKAIHPGLVYDAVEKDYVRFLCGQGYDTRVLQIITGDNSSCTQANKGTVWELNLPSFAFSTSHSRNFSVVFHRTVTNVGSAASRYQATITPTLPSLNIQVEPNVLVFTSLGEKKSFTLKIEGNIPAKILSTSLVWNDGTYHVRSPIVVYSPPRYK
ncbi:cucumisin-like [Abrus precatorius]|uniref:Cucumisin-like n=1 Tax=Abrus precatorius TaxID=3816 RepID=A0A8B8MIE9_ABRPR|nr:cucumisin-like [Abrus precatorius]